jgi:hypothetical protein
MMTHTIPPELYVALIMAVPAVIGGWLAYGRGMNWLLWGILCGLFPVFILAVWFTRPRKEIKGFFRRCGVCGEWIKWREEPCRYCAYRQEQEKRAANPEPEQASHNRP